MPKSTVAEGSEYWHEEGTFGAILRSVEDRKIEFTYKSHHKAVQRGTVEVGDTGLIHRWKWTFEFLDGPHAGTEIDMETDPSIELKGWSLSRMAYEALQGAPVSLGDDIDTDLVVGMKARLTLKHQPPRQAGDRVFYDTKVIEVLPALDGATSSQYQDDEPPF